ncbi:hypothetical protein C8R44DRAFT_742227 [Mycena epipterygia]|nr:hypothetical protein C8R44DRAFT_742227 [Mycena epipterygia]
MRGGNDHDSGKMAGRVKAVVTPRKSVRPSEKAADVDGIDVDLKPCSGRDLPLKQSRSSTRPEGHSGRKKRRTLRQRGPIFISIMISMRYEVTIRLPPIRHEALRHYADARGGQDATNDRGHRRVMGAGGKGRRRSYTSSVPVGVERVIAAVLLNMCTGPN